MAWYVIGALVIAALIVVNALVFVFRTMRRPSAARRASWLRRESAPSRNVVALLAVGTWTVCFGATRVAPGTALGQAMSAPWVLASLAAWLMAAATLVASVVELLRRRRRAHQPDRRFS